MANSIPESPLEITQLPRQPDPIPIPELPPADDTPEPIPEAPLPDTPIEGETFKVEKINVIGSTIFNEQQFNPIIKPLEGRTVSSEELRQAVQAISQLYLDEGYLNSRAILGSIEGGIVTIKVIEGTIPDDQIEIIGTDRLYNYVLQRIKLGIGTPLNVRKLEEQLRLLQNDPLFERVEASLRPPTQEDGELEQKGLQSESRLVVRVQEADPFVGSIGSDNYSPPSIGGERMVLNLRYRNVSGLGDQVYTSYRPRFQAFTNTYRVEGGYEVPVNAKNGTVSIGTLIEQNRVINGPPSGIEELNINGNSQRYFINYRQPFIRTPRQEFALSWGFRYYQGRTFIGDIAIPFSEGPDQKGITRTSVISFGQDYTYRQPTGAWAVRSLLNFGIGALNATENPSPIPDGQFFSWLLQGQRVQVINDNNLLIAQMDLQLTPNSLLSSEQFVMGGAQSVRGYRQNLLAGDNGLRFSLEDRLILVRNQEKLPFFTLAPFFDLGVVWNNEDNPNEIVADKTFIAGLGLGFIIQPGENMTIRLDYAPPLIDVNTRGQNIQDNGFYFNVNYGF
jgi:hemolysin activation/secretion protein